MPEFEKFPKIPRLNRECIITEKIDGTNGQIRIEPGVTLVGSRNRWIYPGKGTDNYEFAQWVEDNEPFLRETLGEGTHYGEWFGQGIARNYGLEERRFALFNTSRWGGLKDWKAAQDIGLTVVPELWRTEPTLTHIEADVWSALLELAESGSRAVPGFMKPEGIVVYHTAAKQLFKVTLENDEKPKGSTE